MTLSNVGQVDHPTGLSPPSLPQRSDRKQPAALSRQVGHARFTRDTRCSG